MRGPAFRSLLAALAVVATASVAGCEACSGAVASQGGGNAGSGTSAQATSVPDFSRTEHVPEDASTWLATPEVLGVVNPDHLPVYSGETGSVEGTIRIVGDEAPLTLDKPWGNCPAAKTMYERLFRAGPIDPANPKSPRPLADAIVAVTGYAGFVPEKRATKVITLKGCVPSQKTIDLTFGQRIEFRNFDPQMYAPAVIQEKRAAIRALPPNGQSVFVEIRQPGYFAIEDQTMARWLKMDAFVLQFPLHTASAVDGSYRIDGIPIGKVNVGARLPPIHREATTEVTIRPNVVEHVDLEIAWSPSTEPTADSGPPVPRPTLH